MNPPTYSDPNVKGNTFRGTVTVTGQVPAETLTLSAKPRTGVYGGKATLTGTLSNQKVGEKVDVLATPCGQTAATKVTTVQTTTGGAYTAVVQPLKNTVYTVKVKNTSSQAVTVKVRPRLRLGKVASHRYSLRVFAAQSFAGKYGSQLSHRFGDRPRSGRQRLRRIHERKPRGESESASRLLKQTRQQARTSVRLVSPDRVRRENHEHVPACRGSALARRFDGVARLVEPRGPG